MHVLANRTYLGLFSTNTGASTSNLKAALTVRSDRRGDLNVLGGQKNTYASGFGKPQSQSLQGKFAEDKTPAVNLA